MQGRNETCIEIRNLTRKETAQLLKEAPKSETKFLSENNVANYEFFNSGDDVQGLVINNRPIYIAMIRNGFFWTVVNRDVKEKISLCKYAKRHLKIWIKKFKELHAMMHKDNKENMKWVEWLGFKKISENAETVTYRLGV